MEEIAVKMPGNTGNWDEIFPKKLEEPVVAKKPKKTKVEDNVTATPKPPKKKRVSKPVTILMTPEMRGVPEIEEQVAGHNVIYTDQLPEGMVPDVMLGNIAWKIAPPLYKYVKIAIKEARSRKYAASDAVKAI